MANDKKKMVEAITAQEVDFAQWYTDICTKAELVEYSSVKALLCCAPMAMQSGRTSRKFWMAALRQPATKTWPCLC